MKKTNKQLRHCNNVKYTFKMNLLHVSVHMRNEVKETAVFWFYFTIYIYYSKICKKIYI